MDWFLLRLLGHCVDLMLVTAPLWIAALLAGVHCRSMRAPYRFYSCEPGAGCGALPAERRLTRAEAVGAAYRASVRAARGTAYELRRRLPSLLTYAIVAPMLGALMLCLNSIGIGILLAISHHHYEPVLLMVEALRPLLFTIPAGLAAFYLHRHLQARARQMQLEMQCAALDIANYLSVRSTHNPVGPGV